ncbi:MAG: hypothetical protein EXR65_00540 [Dehalococcoidia bacterium]|nr:hypothetical protein [Dehalococcoidia bacterium]
MTTHRRLEIGDWLQRLLPRVESYGGERSCWVARTKTRNAEHHPPYYWLARALDDVERAGQLGELRERLVAAHGADGCGGGGERDQRAQDVLSATCALAWALEQLGPATLEHTADGERLLVRVPTIEAAIAPRRLWPARTLELLLQQVAAGAEAAARDLDGAGALRGRIYYLDFNLSGPRFSYDVGYDGPLTEPVRAWLKHHAAERGLGWVLTRPFQWGTPIEAWY